MDSSCERRPSCLEGKRKLSLHKKIFKIFESGDQWIETVIRNNIEETEESRLVGMDFMEGNAR